jgi:hypothetical protein
MRRRDKARRGEKEKSRRGDFLSSVILKAKIKRSRLLTEKFLLFSFTPSLLFYFLLVV